VEYIAIGSAASTNPQLYLLTMRDDFRTLRELSLSKLLPLEVWLQQFTSDR
jgi:hypothetical protein